MLLTHFQKHKLPWKQYVLFKPTSRSPLVGWDFCALVNSAIVASPSKTSKNLIYWHQFYSAVLHWQKDWSRPLDEKYRIDVRKQTRRVKCRCDKNSRPLQTKPLWKWYTVSFWLPILSSIPATSGNYFGIGEHLLPSHVAWNKREELVRSLQLWSSTENKLEKIETVAEHRMWVCIQVQSC